MKFCHCQRSLNFPIVFKVHIRQNYKFKLHFYFHSHKSLCNPTKIHDVNHSHSFQVWSKLTQCLSVHNKLLASSSVPQLLCKYNSRNLPLTVTISIKFSSGICMMDSKPRFFDKMQKSTRATLVHYDEVRNSPKGLLSLLNYYIAWCGSQNA